MTSDTALAIVTEGGAVLKVVAAIIPQPSFENMVSIKRWFGGTTHDASIPVSHEHAFTKGVPVQQFRLVVLDRHRPPRISPCLSKIN
jgi:hypothetical protein